MDITFDDSLIRAAQAGDSDAFRQLIGDSYDLIYRCALRWSGHRTDAEDIAQLACIKVGQSLAGFRFEAAYSSWLYRVVINCAKDWQKSQRRHQTPYDATLDDTVGGFAYTDASENHHFLWQVLNYLSELGDDYKETVILVHGEGLSHKEAAAILAVKESTVSWRLHQVRKHLQSLPEFEF